MPSHVLKTISVTSIPRHTSDLQCNRQIRRIRLIFYPILIVLGLIETWYCRFGVFSDGISYIEIATKYLNGDWSHAINAYWSPLFSWLIALAFLVFRPSAYWQVSILHVVNLVGFCGALVAFDFLLSEIGIREEGRRSTLGFLPLPTIYICAFCVFPLALLRIISFDSPDIFGALFTLLLAALILRIERTGGSPALFVTTGAVLGFFYLDRTAFAACIPVCLLVIAILLRKQRRPIVAPVLIMTGVVVLLVTPYIFAISRKTGRLTIGESGRLNYGWEVDGAARTIHWQGEPFDIGTPKHATMRINSSPAAYIFKGPIPATYSPWFDPTYWYEGLQPKLKWIPQLRVLSANLIGSIRLLCLSPVVLAAFILATQGNLKRWLRHFLSFWPILVPAIAGIAIYSVVYVEKRYIVGSLLILWAVFLFIIEIRNNRWIRWAPLAVSLLCLLTFAYWVAFRNGLPVKTAFVDLISRREPFPNYSYEIAQQLSQIGLHPGDSIAFIGSGINADWPRIAKVTIIGEVPLLGVRAISWFTNVGWQDAAEVQRFWQADGSVRNKILNEFRKAGAVMAVTDSQYWKGFPPEWKLVLPASELAALPKDKETGEIVKQGDQIGIKTRYLWLTDSPSAR